MARSRFFLALFALVACFALTFGTASADPGGGKGRTRAKPVKARITWSTARVEQTLAPGQTAEVTVTLTSNVDVDNVTLRVPRGLARIVTVEPASFTSLKAGVATPVKLVFSMPADQAHSQGGVIQVRSGQRALPSHLSVKVTVPGGQNEDDD